MSFILTGYVVPTPPLSPQVDQSPPLPPRPPSSSSSRPPSSPREIPLPTTERDSGGENSPFSFPRGPFPPPPLAGSQVPAGRNVCVPPPSQDPLFSDTSEIVCDDDAAEEINPPIVIAVFGQTGTGKTSFIKAVTGEDLKVGHDLTSCSTHYPSF